MTEARIATSRSSRTVFASLSHCRFALIKCTRLAIRAASRPIGANLCVTRRYEQKAKFVAVAANPIPVRPSLLGQPFRESPRSVSFLNVSFLVFHPERGRTEPGIAVATKPAARSHGRALSVRDQGCRLLPAPARFADSIARPIPGILSRVPPRHIHSPALKPAIQSMLESAFQESTGEECAMLRARVIPRIIRRRS